ncbi:hypothetical protein [Rhizorhabdus dicambivorans]|uniref:Uncharacterized protein n=1 Tax=Rhizorhabdus dicambivorans TaxID=1850238 RepID=A0A2A4FYU9_9SPHN|nr:hypothetical protein [Rhizorhabdus dicambivorans]ATE66552.1 hypothetical protein CMV14_20825 [Rhizorhabdus dicambivorans]PCE43964.1 hypothetical protein COO09_03325 [Rhizorhabdus dicambivorans]
MTNILYRIRFDGIGQTTVCARSPSEAIELAELFSRLGKTNIVVSGYNDRPVPLGELQKLILD